MRPRRWPRSIRVPTITSPSRLAPTNARAHPRRAASSPAGAGCGTDLRQRRSQRRSGAPAGEARRGGRQALAKEYDILEQLVIHAGKVLTHRHLLREVWRDESVDPQYLRVYVRQLRQKIEADPSTPRHVLTEPGNRLPARLTVDNCRYPERNHARRGIDACDLPLSSSPSEWEELQFHMPFLLMPRLWPGVAIHLETLWACFYIDGRYRKDRSDVVPSGHIQARGARHCFALPERDRTCPGKFISLGGAAATVRLYFGCPPVQWVRSSDVRQ